MEINLRGLLVLGILFIVEFCCIANGNLVFPVQRKFKGREWNLSAIKAHDEHRRGRFLSAIDLPLGGNGRPSDAGLYYTKFQLGSPPKDYYVQIDTGSDILWLNCIECSTCPKKSGLGMDLPLFDPKGSSTANLVSCNDGFCTSTYDGPISGCQQDMLCQYSITYGDGSQTAGYFVKDYLTYDKVSGNLHTSPENSSVIFGCSGKQAGNSGSSANEALNGIVGFGQANSSLLSQLAASGKVKKIFSHCLDSENGGGIFAIGEVVKPKVKTTPLLPKMAHYNVDLKEIVVGKEVIKLPTDIFEFGNGGETIIDSGTTLAYLPSMIYDQLLPKVFAQQPGLKLFLFENQFTCFQYDGNLDDGFPPVTFNFEESLSLTVHAHDYIFKIKHSEFQCLGWQKMSGQTKSRKDLILLGDIALSNRLVVYDIENMAIGWTDYNCSSSIEVKDEKTGSAYQVSAHDMSSASPVLIGKILTSFLLLIAMLINLID